MGRGVQRRATDYNPIRPIETLVWTTVLGVTHLAAVLAAVSGLSLADTWSLQVLSVLSVKYLTCHQSPARKYSMETDRPTDRPTGTRHGRSSYSDE